MALITCKDCKKEFSTDAPRCPHCSAKKPLSKFEKSRIRFVSIVACLGGALAFYVANHPVSSNEQSKSEMQADPYAQPAIEPENISDYPEGTSPHFAFDQCVTKSIKNGDGDPTTTNKCYKLGLAWCEEIGLSTEYSREILSTPSPNEQCPKVQISEEKSILIQYGNKEQKALWNEIWSGLNRNDLIVPEVATSQADATSINPDTNASASQPEQQVFKASFDCAKEKKDTLEVLICADPELSSLDGQEANEYAKMLRTAQSSGHNQTTTAIEEQKQFLKTRIVKCPIPAKPLSENDTAKIITCLKKTYTARLNTLEENDALAAFGGCLIRSMAAGSSDILAMRNCVGKGIDWCNKAGMKTSQSTQILPVSGRVEIDNFQCAYNLEGRERHTRYDYNTELENYLGSEGGVYRPLLFDIRSVAWGQKSPTDN